MSGTTTSGRPGILIVDDDPTVRSVLGQWLEDFGFQTWQAGNGVAALEEYQLHRDQIAVVLLDIEMPEMDGPQTLAVLRHRDQMVPCCFMSASPNPFENLGHHEVAGFFRKPFDLRQVASRLRQIANDGARSTQLVLERHGEDIVRRIGRCDRRAHQQEELPSKMIDSLETMQLRNSEAAPAS